MASQISGPEPASWLLAAVRGLHPARWLLGLTGVAATVLLASVAQSLFDGRVPRAAGWFVNPAAHAREFVHQLESRSAGTIVVRLAPIVMLAAGVWSIVGCWIARHEFLTRRQRQDYLTPAPAEPGATARVGAKIKELLLFMPAIVMFTALLYLPLTLAAGVNDWLGGPGAVVVAVVLPIVLVGNLLLLLIAAGALPAFPLMPTTIAIENSDVFDGLSRGFNYIFARLIPATILHALALGLAALPLAGTLYFLAGNVDNWPAVSGRVAVWIAAGLSAAVFWSLQSLAYLQLRRLVDGVDADVDSANPAANVYNDSTSPAAAPSLQEDGRSFSNLVVTAKNTVLMAAVWLFTALAIFRIGGDNGNWLLWGMTENGFMPMVTGLHLVAAVIGGIWGALWLACPLLLFIRARIRRARAEAGTPAENCDTMSREG